MNRCLSIVIKKFSAMKWKGDQFISKMSYGNEPQGGIRVFESKCITSTYYKTIMVTVLLTNYLAFYVNDLLKTWLNVYV